MICFDGTWQRLKQPTPTNIAIIARSIAHTHTLADGTKIPQIVIYSQGVGSNVDALGKDGFMDGFSEWLNRMLGGVFGEGLEDNIVETYLRLAFNYEDGDEIYVFGFSRGAFCARSFAGLIGCCRHCQPHACREGVGCVPALSRASRQEGDQVRAGGLSSARGAISAPAMARASGRRTARASRAMSRRRSPISASSRRWGSAACRARWAGWRDFFNKRFGFHDMQIGAGVLSARHAVAVDENRLGFPPTLWEGVDEANKRPHCADGKQHYAQRWFIGTHGDVGGGEGSPLSAAPLKWMAEGAAECGLRFYGTYGEDESPLSQAVREAGLVFKGKISRPRFWDSLSPMNYPLASRRIWAGKSRKDGRPWTMPAACWIRAWWSGCRTAR